MMFTDQVEQEEERKNKAASGDTQISVPPGYAEPPMVIDIEQVTLQNHFFRRVLHTDERQQLVVMTLLPGEEIGLEVHPETTQFLRCEKGNGMIVAGKERVIFRDGVAAVIPPGTLHNVINTSHSEKLFLYTIYSPPHHPPGTIKLRAGPGK